jgi:alpha-maltose-1-phosphate synthase
MTISADTQSNSANFALEFFPDSIALDPKGFVGRRAAGNGLLQAALRPENGPPAAIAVSSPENSRALDEALRHFGLNAKEVTRIHLGDMAALRDIGCLMSMGPEISELTWRRRLMDDSAFSIVGLTHTLCTDRTQAALNALLIDPVQPWDAIICTSHAGKSALVKIIDTYRGYLTAKGFTVPDPALQLPVIPLGIHCANFYPDQRLSLRKQFRSRYGLGERDACVLWFGRLDPKTKAQPSPMITAARRAQARIGDKANIHLFFVFRQPQAG